MAKTDINHWVSWVYVLSPGMNIILNHQRSNEIVLEIEIVLDTIVLVLYDGPALKSLTQFIPVHSPQIRLDIYPSSKIKAFPCNL